MNDRSLSNGLGLSRTGTLSIRQALFELGYFDVYHGTSFGWEDRHGAELWEQTIRRKFESGGTVAKDVLDELFGHCM